MDAELLERVLEGRMVDRVVVQSILHCLLPTDNQHLLLRTAEGDVSTVAKLAGFTLSSVFGYSTNRRHIRHSTADVRPFVRSLFLTKHSRRSIPDDHLPRALVLTGLEHAGPNAHRALLDIIADNRVVSDGHVFPLPDRFILVYVCPFDPREMPPIYPSLLDRFAMSTTVSLHPSTSDAFHSPSSSSPSFSLPTPPTRTPLFPPHLLQSLRTLHSQTYISPSLSLYISDLFSAARHHNELETRLLTLRSHRHADALIRAATVLGRASNNDNIDIQPETPPYEIGNLGIDLHHLSPHVLNVDEADVARIIPRVISHRIRVLDTPEDELLASAVYPAVGKKEMDWERRTVKDILVEILSEV